MASQTAGRLPVQLAPMVGRQRELRDVVAALPQSRLLTLTGPGGTGKTRLALAAAAAARESYRQGVYWVELAPVDDPALVPLTVASGVGARERPGQDVTETIAEHIGDRSVLIVLDNCEHLAAAAAELAARLLRACRALSVLATSREALGVDGERQLAVPPLALPPDGAATDLATLAEFDAVRFFEQRAQLVLPSFRLAGDNASAVHQVCSRLDGLPLAIELAAARLRTLSISQLAERLDDVFAVLVGGARTAPRRHQTLRATLDWSHDLLADDERAAFRRLAVLSGVFTLAAAEHVASGDDIGPEQVLDLLTRLADKSLVHVDHGDVDQARYNLLSTVRDYAWERLAQASEADSARRAHLAYFADFVERIEPRIVAADEVPGAVSLQRELNRIEAETPNLRAALDFARTSRDVRAALRLVGPLERYAYLRGQYSEVRYWMDTAVSIGPEAPARLVAKALLGSGRLALLQCDYGPATGKLEAALRLYRELEDPRGIARTLQVLGSVAREQGRYAQSTDLHAESLRIAEATGDKHAVASAHGYLGLSHWLQCDFERAATECTIALRMSRQLGDVEGIAWSLISLGAVARCTGERARAAELLGESLSISEKVGFREGIAWSLEQLGLLAGPAGSDLLRRSLEVHRELRARWRICSLLDDLAALECAGDNSAQAARLLGAAQAIREEIGTVVAPCERAQHDEAMTAARTALGEAAFDAAWREGMATGPAELPVESAPVVQEQPAAVPQLRIKALGDATVYRGGAALAAADWGYAKPRELLFLLATSPPMTREQIGLALWPDHSGSQLGNALHTALREVRRALGDPEWVRYEDGKYSFNSAREHECDVEIFERSIDAARRAKPPSAALPDLQRAIAAYGGDFLDGMAAGDWASARRGGLRRSFEAALLAVGRLDAAAGRYQRAVTAFRLAVAHEPLNETAHRELMSSWAGLGETARAIRHYEDLAAQLRDHVGVPPAAETTALYRRLLGEG